jgi:thiamine pyrophosphokinase
MGSMVALILADGDAPTRAQLEASWPGWSDGIDLVIAADGGARHAIGLGVPIDLWVGDGDSLGEAGLVALAATGVPIERSRPDKDETDTELAIRAALARDADRLVIVGALGGPRIDHALANVGLLALADLAGRRAVILDAGFRISLLRAPGDTRGTGATDDDHMTLAGAPGDLVSLLPHGGDVEGVTTDGLAFPLADEPLSLGSTRGVSNVVRRPDATVVIRHGLLLVIESPATL